MTSHFRVRYSELNSTNLQDLSSSLNVINKNDTTTSLIITSSQLLNLLETPVLIIPSPGTGAFNVVNRVVLYLNFTGTAYTESKLSFTELYYDQTQTTSTNSGLANIVNAVIGSSVSCIDYDNSGGGLGAPASTLLINQAIYLSTTHSITNGTSNLTLTVNYSTYYI